MSLQHYSFQIGEIADIFQGRGNNLAFDLYPDHNRKEEPEITLVTAQPLMETQSVIVEPNDLIISPDVMQSVMSPEKSAIGKPFDHHGFLIKLPISIVKPFGIKYIRFKLTIEIHKLILQTHRFASKSIINLEQLSKLTLTLDDREAKLVNGDPSTHMKRLNQAITQALFAHKQAIDQWQEDVMNSAPINKRWH